MCAHGDQGETLNNLKAPLVGLAATATLVAGVGLPLTAAQAGDGNYKYARAVDGDTVQLGNGKYVRLLGYDTPEVGTCGYAAAKSKMASLVSGGVKLVNVSGKDRYGRTLAYVKTKDGRDIGTVMLRQGLAIARYDGLDGYGWHPKQKKYRTLDRKNGKITCTTSTTKPSKPSTPAPAPAPVVPVAPPPVNVYYANCDAVRAAGKAPIRIGDPGYGRHLDRDGDGSGCE